MYINQPVLLVLISPFFHLFSNITSAWQTVKFKRHIEHGVCCIQYTFITFAFDMDDTFLPFCPATKHKNNAKEESCKSGLDRNIGA